MILLTLQKAKKLKHYTNLKDEQLKERITSLNQTVKKYSEIKHLDDLLTVILVTYKIKARAFHNVKIQSKNVIKARRVFIILALQVRGGQSLKNIGDFLGVTSSTVSHRVSAALEHSKDLKEDLEIIKEKYSLI